MPTECPVCRTPLTRPRSASGRVACARCGESVAVGDDYAPATPGVTAAPARPSARPALLLGLLIALGLAAYFAVRHWPSLAPPPENALLSLLPADATVVARLRPPEDETLDRTLDRAGLPAEALDRLGALQIPLDGIEELAVGVVVLPETLVPRGVVAVRFVTPEVAARSLARLGGTATGRGDISQTSARAVSVFYRQDDPRTVLLATEIADLEIPGGPEPIPFAAELEETRASIPPYAAGWLATATQDWGVIPAVVLGQKFLSPTGPNRAEGVTAVWLALTPDGTLVGGKRTASGEWEDLTLPQK